MPSYKILKSSRSWPFKTFRVYCPVRNEHLNIHGQWTTTHYLSQYLVFTSKTQLDEALTKAKERGELS